METIIEQPKTEVKLLVHFETQKVKSIIEETEIRRRLLNAMIDAGISPNEISKVVSQEHINDVLFQKSLQLSKTMAREFAAGKKQRYLMESYTLDISLEHLQSVMQQFVNYPLPHRGFNKFQHLKLIDGRYELDQASLEREFIMNKYKIYVDEWVMAKIKKLDAQIDFLIEENEPSGRAMGYQLFAERLTCDSSLSCNQLPQRRFMIKRAYLLGLMERRN